MKRKFLILLIFGTLLSQHVFLGDMNQDSELDVTDIVQLVNCILFFVPDEHQFINADVNQDGNLNILDITIVVELIMDTWCRSYERQCNPATLECCTDHDIEFEVNTWGILSSKIFDTWIFSSDLIYGIGRLNLFEAGHYSGAMWDGESWQVIELIREWAVLEPRGIWAFSQNDIYFAHGSILHWDGDLNTDVEMVWERDYINYPELAVYNIWAFSPDDMYFVGPGGCIVHYDGEEFVYMDSGTDLWLRDVWGYENPDTGEKTVWACAYDATGNLPIPSVFLVYRGDEWEPVFDMDELFYQYLYDQLSGGVTSIWASENHLYVLTHNGLYKCPLDTQGEGTLILEAEWYVDGWSKVRGTSDNDIFIAGIYGEIIHYDGETWHQFDLGSNYNPDNIHINGSTVLFGGNTLDGMTRALLIRGTR